MKEIAFFTISILEIVLTAFIVCKILKATDNVKACENKFKKTFPKKLEAFKNFQKKLSVAKKILKVQAKYSYAIKGVLKIAELFLGFSKFSSVLKFLGFKF